MTHPYVLADRFEEITSAEAVRVDPLCDRRIALFGYLRGCNLKPGTRVHLAGVGDFDMVEVSALPDPCPLPDSVKRRSLDDRERLIYAPMSDVGRLLYDKDAMYVNIPDHVVNFSRPEADGGADGAGLDVAPAETLGVQMVRSLQDAQATLNEKMSSARIRVFHGSVDPVGSDSDVLDDDSPADDDEQGDGEWSDEEDEQVAGPSEDTRARRPAAFGDAAAADESDADPLDNSDDSDGEYDELDAEGLGGAAQWKRGLGGPAVGTRVVSAELMVRVGSNCECVQLRHTSDSQFARRLCMARAPLQLQLPLTVSQTAKTSCSNPSALVPMRLSWTRWIPASG